MHLDSLDVLDLIPNDHQVAERALYGVGAEVASGTVAAGAPAARPRSASESAAASLFICGEFLFRR